MTTITKTQILNSVNSVEKLAAYATLALARMNPDLKILELPGESQKAVEVVLSSDTLGKPRLIIRVSLELNADYATNGLPLFNSVIDLSNTALPSAYIQV